MTGERSGEYRAKSVEAAISAGLAALRLSRDEVEVEIIRQGSRGVLGIGAEDAIVRLTAIPPVKTQARPAPQREAETPPRNQVAPATKPETRQAAPAAPRPASRQPETKPVQMMADEKTMAGAQKGRDMLAELLDHMGVKAQVEILEQSQLEEDERTLVLNIVGDDLGQLIGRQNETLSALELIIRLMVNQQTRSRTSFTVDVNGYRAKRVESLRRLALRMADQAAQSGRTVAMEPLPPAERRIVHLTLRDHPSVTTQSVGEGDRRKVTLIPRKS